MKATRMWWLSLGASAGVVGVVAGLLAAIAAQARSIDRHADAIWTVGKQIAGNTVSIWMLEQTNDRLGQAVEVARSLERSVASIDEKLRALAPSDRARGG